MMDIRDATLEQFISWANESLDEETRKHIKQTAETQLNTIASAVEKNPDFYSVREQLIEKLMYEIETEQLQPVAAGADAEPDADLRTQMLGLVSETIDTRGGA